MAKNATGGTQVKYQTSVHRENRKLGCYCIFFMLYESAVEGSCARDLKPVSYLIKKGCVKVH